jgi:peptide/nickel transport system substrate-binding protein
MLAWSGRIDPDGNSYVFLRTGAPQNYSAWSNAEAVKFRLERHLTMQGSFRKPELASVDRVEVVDPLTIKLVLKSPFSPLLAQLTDRAGMMVSPKAAKEAGDKFGLRPVCAGPYKFVERVQQDRMVFEKFADYWNKDNVFIDRIVFLPIVDATVRLANLKSGGLDLIERVLATDIKDVRADSRLKLSTAIELGYQGITLNIGKDKAKGPLSQSAKVRQALDLSIDREAINQVVFNGEFKPGNQWVNPDHPYYQKAFPIRTRDVAKAKALLKEAGVTPPVNVDFMVPKGAETEAVAQVVQSMASEAGFDMKIRVTEFATSLKQAEAGEYQAYMLAWSGRIDPDGNSYVFLRTGAPQNYSAWSNAEADKALDDARLVTDLAQRKAIYEKLAKAELDEQALLYIYHRRILIAHTTKLEGYKQMPDGLVRVVGLKLK